MTTTAAERTKIEPSDLRLIQTWPLGHTSTIHVHKNHDLCIRDTAGKIASSAENGAVLVSLELDGETIERVDFQPAVGQDAEELLLRTIEVLQVTLDAVRRVDKA